MLAEAFGSILLKHTKKDEADTSVTHAAAYPMELAFSEGLAFAEVFTLPRIVSRAPAERTHWHDELGKFAAIDAGDWQTKIDKHVEKIRVARVNAGMCSVALQQPMKWNPEGQSGPFEVCPGASNHYACSSSGRRTQHQKNKHRELSDREGRARGYFKCSLLAL